MLLSLLQALYKKTQQYKLTGKKDKEQTLQLINKYLGISPFLIFKIKIEKYYKEIENKFGDKYSDYLKYFYNEWKKYFINHWCSVSGGIYII